MENQEIHTPQETPVIAEKSSKKSFLVLLSFVLLLGALTIAYLLLDGPKYIESFLPKDVEKVQEEETVSDDNEIDEYADWQVYINTEYGISFKYPSDWEVEEYEDGSIIAHAIGEKEGTERQTYLWILPDTNSTNALEYIKNLQEKIENEGSLMNSSLNYNEIIMWEKEAYIYIPRNVDFLSSGYVVENKGNILDIRFRGLAELGYWHIIDSVTFLDS